LISLEDIFEFHYPDLIMRIIGSLLILCLFLVQPTLAQNKKIDKSLQKIDALYQEGSFAKASNKLKKLDKSTTSKLGKDNPYAPGFYVRQAKINVGLGKLFDFDNILQKALTTSITVFGENSSSYAITQIDVAEVYMLYGNYRVSNEYLKAAESLLKKNEQLTDEVKHRLALLKGETNIGLGFCNQALDILRGSESYLASRAVTKETKVVDGNLKTVRIPTEEISQRFGDYAKLLRLIAQAYSVKGSLNSADSAFLVAKRWIKSSRKYLLPTDIALEENNFQFAKMLIENGNPLLQGKNSDIKDIQLENTLKSLKKKVKPTNTLAQDLYLAYLHQLLLEENKLRYVNTKKEFEKSISKYFSRNSVVRINLQAVEFDSKLSKEKTKDLEKNALAVVNSAVLPKNHPTTLLILKFLFDTSINEKRYANAESYLNQMCEIKKELYGENTPAYHLALLDLANFYLDYTNKVAGAGKIYNESFENIVAKEIGDRHKNIINIYNHMATYYETTDQFAKATQTLQKASRVSQFIFDKEDILFARELTYIAKLELKLGNYDAAEEKLSNASKIIDLRKNRNLKEWHATSIETLETQAKLYGLKGMFDEAETNLERAAKVFNKAPADVTSELSSVEELAPLYINLGRFSQADKLLRVQIPDYERLFGVKSTRLIEPLVNNGRVLLMRGDYTEAERIAIRANQIATEAYGEVSTKTAPTQKLLSDIYYTLGDYEKAEFNIKKALQSQEKQFGRNHIEVAKSLSQLAIIKFYKGDNKQETEKLMIESREIIANKLGTDNPQYAEILKNISIFYISEKRFDIAFNSLTVAEGIWKSKTGNKNNVNTAGIYTLTGDVYYQIKNYNKAEEFYTKAKDIYEKNFSSSHPEYVKVISKMSKVYYMKKDYKRAKRDIEISLNNYEQFIKNFFPALSEREKAKYWNTIKSDFEFYNTLAFSNLDDFKDLTEKVYNYQLLTKALLLSSSIKMRERILNSTDEELKTQYNNWVQRKELLTLALSMSPTQLAENEINPTVLQQEIERLEKELSTRSELFGQSFENKRITYTDIKKSLKANETAIEMVRYRHFDHVLTDSVIYAALYIKKDQNKPKAILLGDGKRLENRFFKYYRNTMISRIPDVYSYGAYWKPIVDEIGQVSTIYLSADGVYNQINLEAIPTPDGKYVLDNANIVLVSNTKDLYINSIKTRMSVNENTATMFGNPTFYADASSSKSISQLPGTEKEIIQLKQMLNQKGWTTSEYIEKSASEEKIKELVNPKIFHIATHGFYTPSTDIRSDIEANEATMTQNPLLRTGLLLTGAGDLMDKTTYNFNMENGILTAYEAMSLNLDKTDLVVLSACETGLGDLEAGEGVYGLQRAFLVAGAKVLVMSMFKVDDEATQKLMLKFYQKWLSTGQLRQSFDEAKKELRTEYPDPIFWGAFIMIGSE
jgi:CHAT domain-containing protein